MGVDVCYIAQNVRGWKPGDFAACIRSGNWPGVSGPCQVDERRGVALAESLGEHGPRSAYHYAEFDGDLVIVHDGQRFFGLKRNLAYHHEVMTSLWRVCGGQVDLWDSGTGEDFDLYRKFRARDPLLPAPLTVTDDGTFIDLLDERFGR